MRQLSPGFAKLLPEAEEEGDDGDPPSKSTSGIIRRYIWGIVKKNKFSANKNR
jgi:hypothetical protein